MKSTTLMRIQALPLVAAIITWAIVSQMAGWATEAKLDEKIIEIEKSLDRRANDLQRDIDRYSNWDTYSYDIQIAEFMAAWDAENLTFAAAYRVKEGVIDNISARHPSYEAAPFDPFDFDEFVKAIGIDDINKNTTIHGRVVVAWSGNPEADISARDMYVIYRWVPSLVTDPYLLVVGISKYTVETPLDDAQVILGAVGAFVIMACCIAPPTATLSHYLATSRKKTVSGLSQVKDREESNNA